MWFSTKEEAEKAAERKSVEWQEDFVVVKDSEQPNCYWAQRKSAQ